MLFYHTAPSSTGLLRLPQAILSYRQLNTARLVELLLHKQQIHCIETSTEINWD